MDLLLRFKSQHLIMVHLVKITSPTGSSRERPGQPVVEYSTWYANTDKRRPHKNLRRQLVADFAHNNAHGDCADLADAPTVNLTLLGEQGSGKSTLLARLLVGQQALSKGFKLLDLKPSEATPVLVRTAYGVAQITDTPSPHYLKNALKQLADCDHVFLCVR